MVAEDFAPKVCMGAVMHERTRPVHNRFTYPLATLRIPLSHLEGLRVPLLGVDRPGVFSLRSRDHGARNGSPLLPWIRDLLDRLPDTKVEPEDVDLPPLGHEPSVEGYTVLKPLPPYNP